MRESMNHCMFIHLSLNLPNQAGQRQFLMDEVSGTSLFRMTLKNLLKANRIDHFILLCSDSPVDHCLERLTLELDPDRKKLKILRVPGGHPWSFDSQSYIRDRRNPSHCIETSGAYHLDYFLRLHDLFPFDTAVLFWADSFPLMQGKTIDEMICISKGTIQFFGGEHFLIPVIVLPFQEALDRAQELKSENNNDYLYDKNRLLKRTIDPRRLKFLDHEYERACSSILQLARKTGENLQAKLGETVMNPYFPVLYEPRLKPLLDFLGIINHAIALFEKNDFENLLGAGDDGSKELEEILKTLAEQVPLADHLIIDITSPEGRFMDFSGFECLLKGFSLPPSMLTFGCFEDPTSNPDLVSMIRAGQNFHIQSIGLRICGMLSFSMLEKFIQAGLGFAVLDADRIGMSKVFDMGKTLLEIKDRYGDSFLIFVETTFEMENQTFYKKLYEEYQYLLDGITIKPPASPEADQFDLPPGQTPCSWSRGVLVADQEAKLLLCEEVPASVFSTSKENLHTLIKTRGSHPQCLQCTKKNRSNGYSGRAFLSPLIDRQKSFSTHPALLLLKDLLSSLETAKTHETQPLKVKQYLETLVRKGADISEIRRAYPSYRLLCESLLKGHQMEEALDLIELVLKTDPSNEMMHEILNRIS